MTRLIAALSVVLCACSFVTVEGPGNWTPSSGRAPVCDTEARLPVTVDAALAVFGAIGVGVGIDGHDDGKEVGAGYRAASIAAGGAIAVAAVASMVTGLSRARRCRSAFADYLMTPAR